MENSDKPHIKAGIDAFKAERRNAAQNGIEILPSVNGPYAVEKATGLFVGRKGSKGYLLAACQNAANVFAALATGQLTSISADSPALAQLRAAIAKAKGEA